MLPVSESPLLVEKRVCGSEILDLPCLASGHNLILIYEDMGDIRSQGIAVDNDNETSPQKNPVPEKFPYHNWKRRKVGHRKE